MFSLGRGYNIIGSIVSTLISQLIKSVLHRSHESFYPPGLINKEAYRFIFLMLTRSQTFYTDSVKKKKNFIEVLLNYLFLNYQRSLCLHNKLHVLIDTVHKLENSWVKTKITISSKPSCVLPYWTTNHLLSKAKVTEAQNMYSVPKTKHGIEEIINCPRKKFS